MTLRWRVILSPRQSHVQPSLAPTKDVNMKIQIKRLKRAASKKSLAIKFSAMSDADVAVAIRKTVDGFLISKEWKDLRQQAVARYGLICCKCGRESSRKFPINMDHIKPRKYFPELALDIENLQPLCGPCNKRKGNGPAIDYRK